MKKRERRKKKKSKKRDVSINLLTKNKERKNLQGMPSYKLKEMRSWPNLRLTVMLPLPGLLRLRNSSILLPLKDKKSSMKKQRLKLT